MAAPKNRFILVSIIIGLVSMLGAAVYFIIKLMKGSASNDEGETGSEVTALMPNVSKQGKDVPSFCTATPANDANTPHFKLSEFHSKDGTAVPIAVRGNIQKLMQQLEVIRSAAGGKPMSIHSGWRSVTHNKNVGGEDKSYHLCGMAADISVSGVTHENLHIAILELIKEGKIHDGGVGLYKWGVHYDIGPSRRWNML